MDTAIMKLRPLVFRRGDDLVERLLFKQLKESEDRLHELLASRLRCSVAALAEGLVRGLFEAHPGRHVVLQLGRPCGQCNLGHHFFPLFDFPALLSAIATACF